MKNEPVNSLLFNDHGRLRSGWRAGIYFFAFAFLGTGWEILMLVLNSITALGLERDSLRLWIATLVFSFTLSLTLGWACGKLLEGLPLKALGWSFTRGWFKDLLLGLVIGASSIAFACAICLIFGALTLRWNESAGFSGIGLTLLVAGVFFFAGAAMEESVYRGYMFQTFTRARLAWFAIALSSIFFASAHIGNPNFNAFAMINTVLAGLWFSVAYLKTRTLWLAFGAHFTWNWVQGAVFGIPVSGITRITTAPLLQPEYDGWEWLTGGSYGLEAGIACTITLVLSTALIWFLPFIKADEEMLALTNRENSKEAEV